MYLYARVFLVLFNTYSPNRWLVELERPNPTQNMSVIKLA